jgi:hypothetical protein
VRLHYVALLVRIREYAVWNPSMVVILIEEELSLILMRWNHQQIEVVIDFLLPLLPVFVMEVFINPHESLVDNFRDY